MAKKEFKVGEVFQCGLVKLKCVKGNINNPCDKCYISQLSGFCYVYKDIIGHCEGKNREDKSDVIFVKVEDKT